MPEVFTPIELFRESVSFTYQRYRFPALRSVVRAEEFAAFDLLRSIELVVTMAAKIG